MRSNLRYSSILSITVVMTTVMLIFCTSSCSVEDEKMIATIHEGDTIPTLTSYGVSTLISDSGVIRYKMVTEKWDIYTKTNPTKWVFLKGLYIEKFDEKLHVDASIQADTAYYYDKIKLWELRGRVFVRNQEGATFRTEELFWDQGKREIYSHKYMKIVTPDKSLEGTEFKSNEMMTEYEVQNSAGHFPIQEENNTLEPII
ncbi:MAG: LPS export ABC transporter periplasmic protein LptC [Bacteroidaceae bacterium]|nr:LPS export ABC transporter periplasmic protein LptC [Bacteroidaceae bacterium]